MSPHTTIKTLALRGFPRVSGDEPDTGQWLTLLSGFSPRERG